jgi:small subunit ribosomal protein S17
MPKRIMEGTVVSNKMTKTAVVKVERTFLHPLFKKTVRKSKRYHAHDENNKAQVGQIVEIQECPPRSKLKRWEIVSFKGDAA